MFSIQQKRDIANAVQQILRDTGHPELSVGEIQFKLYVHGRFQWSWADIRNNAAVPVPSVNPWNEAQDKSIPADPQHGRERGKVKSLAQYLDDYIEHEIELGNLLRTDLFVCADDYDSVQEMFQQALDAYESTEQVKIRIERV